MSTHGSSPHSDRLADISLKWVQTYNAATDNDPRTAAMRSDIRWLVEQFDALRHAAGDFVTAYRAASMSDEEGLLMATDPDAMRQLWHRVDEAATDVEQAL